MGDRVRVVITKDKTKDQNMEGKVIKLFTRKGLRKPSKARQ